MTKKLFAVFSIVFLFIFVSSVNTQTSATTTNTTTKTSTPSAITPKLQRLELKQEMKNTILMKREEAKAIIKTKRDEFKAKIETIKDQRKKILVERIDVKLATVNAKHTDRFTEVLSKLQQLIDNANADTTKAQAAINAAKTAVETQAAKTYTATITDETALRNNFGTTISQLRLDLMAVHKLVIDAKQAVQALRKDKVIMEKEATRRVPNGNPSTSSAN